MNKVMSKTMTALASCAFALAAGAQEIPVVLFPFREATVASPLDSELKDYHYLVGEPFTNGAVIAELDDSRYRVAFLRAQEHRDFTMRVAQEQRELRKKDFASEMELRKAEYEAKIAQADYADATLSLSRCRFIAPFDGKIAELLTQRYETVKPGQPLFRMIEDGRLFAVANLPMGSVAVGKKMSVIPDGKKAVEGTVHEIAPQADNRTGTVRVRVLVENPKGELTAGMTGMLNLDEPAARPEAESRSEGAAPSPAEGSVDFAAPGPRYRTVPEAFNGEAAPTNGLPPLSFQIEGLRYSGGALGYVLRHNLATVSIATLKRVGELTAGLYDADGKRMACLDPQQISLPKEGTVITNVVPFPAAACADMTGRKRPIKMVVRIEKDIRALVVESGEKTDGRR